MRPSSTGAGTRVRPHGEAHPGPTPHGKAQSAAFTSRRMRFSVTSRRPGGVGPNPPPGCGALWRMPQLGKCARATPRQAAGGSRRGPQASAWGLAAWKGAVWAEGLTEDAPWVRPGHHQAASCGLRRCRELRVRSPARVPLPKGSMGIPSSCLAARQQGIGCSEC